MHTQMTRILIAASVLFLAGQANAQDDGLYEAPTDPNSAFVRVLLPGAAVAVINGTSLDSLSGGLSPYVNVQPGAIELSADEASGSVDVKPGSYYTYAWSKDAGAVALKDSVTSDPAKANVALYNLSDKSAIDLFVPAAKVNAIVGAPAGGSKAVALKAPLKVDVELKSGADTLGKVVDLDLARRSGVSIILSGTNGDYTVTAVKNVYLK